MSPPHAVGSGCLAVDVSRSAFRATKMVPYEGGLVPRSGQYWFVQDPPQFLQRSMLGGHWFEGHPFQTGDYATAETPKPSWVNGAPPAGPVTPSIAYCLPCARLQGGTVTGGEFTLTRPGFSETWPAALVDYFAPDLLRVRAGYNGTNSVEAVFVLSECRAVFGSALCSSSVSMDRLWVERPFPIPDYLVTTTSVPSNQRWGDGLCHAGTTVRLRLTGTLP